MVSGLVSGRALRSTGVLSLFAALALAGCANGGGVGGGGGLNYNPPVASPGVGTLGGAGAGALLGRLAAGSHNNLLATAGGALLGGLAGNVLVDNPKAKNQAAQNQASQDADVQRRLDYDRQSQVQAAQTQKQIADQQAFDQWKAQRDAGTLPQANTGAVGGPVDVTTAQRLLTALGYYRGPIDGSSGSQTRSAVTQFEQAQGLPATGVVTSSLIDRMRRSVAAS